MGLSFFNIQIITFTQILNFFFEEALLAVCCEYYLQLLAVFRILDSISFYLYLTRRTNFSRSFHI
jgi:hypothetical protein